MMHADRTAPDALEDHLGDILQKARTGRNLSISQLSDRTGLSPAQIKQLEDLVLTPRLDQLQRLADVLALDPQKLQRIAEGTWSPRPPSAWVKEKALIIQGRIGSYPVNGYILFDRNTGEAACIDTAFSPEKMIECIAAHRLSLRYILLTHCHQDHMGGVERIQKKTGAELYLHPEEMSLFSQHSAMAPNGFIAADSEFSLGKFRIQPIPTPGHTPGGTSYLTEGLCFVGDALFAGSTGRSMSPQGYRSLLTSLREKVLSLPGETVILPGHGPLTTVGEESQFNPFF